VCGATVERSFRVPAVIRTCENDCGFGGYVREGLADRLGDVPEEARPEDWEELSAEERLRIAAREGVLTIDDLR
jgi:hypothetical protein